jgi:hypothetical protein
MMQPPKMIVASPKHVYAHRRARADGRLSSRAWSNELTSETLISGRTKASAAKNSFSEATNAREMMDAAGCRDEILHQSVDLREKLNLPIVRAATTAIVSRVPEMSTAETA